MRSWGRCAAPPIAPISSMHAGCAACWHSGMLQALPILRQLLPPLSYPPATQNPTPYRSTQNYHSPPALLHSCTTPKCCYQALQCRAGRPRCALDWGDPVIPASGPALLKAAVTRLGRCPEILGHLNCFRRCPARGSRPQSRSPSPAAAAGGSGSAPPGPLHTAGGRWKEGCDERGGAGRLPQGWGTKRGVRQRIPGGQKSKTKYNRASSGKESGGSCEAACPQHKHANAGAVQEPPHTHVRPAGLAGCDDIATSSA